MKAGYPVANQRGFSLVELMVALVIGLLVSGAILQTFVMNTRNVELQQATIRLQEQGRALVNYIGRYARQAGFREDSLVDPPPDLSVKGTDDSLSFRMIASPSSLAPLFNCLGEPIVSQSVSTFSVSGAEISCDATPKDTAAVGTEAPILVSNLAHHRFLFGYIKSGEVSYVSASEIPGPTPEKWEKVIALKLCFVLESEAQILDDAQPETRCYETPDPDQTTRQLQRRVETTIALRNPLGASP